MREMLLLTQTPGGGGGGVGVSCKIPSSPLKPTHNNKRLLSNPTTSKRPLIFLTKQKQSPYLACAKPQNDAAPKQQQPNNVPLSNEPVFVGPEDVPLEGVIQIEKEESFSFDKWGRIALLAGGDVLALLLFSAIGRFSHGFSVLDSDTLRTADPFMAGWFLAAYFIGGYGDDGRGINGMSKGVVAAAKSWALGIPLGILIRAVTLGKTPSYPFILVTMGSTAVLLLGWRTISSKILAVDKSKKSDVYRRGSPFELFELLTSLVRRW